MKEIFFLVFKILFCIICIISKSGLLILKQFIYNFNVCEGYQMNCKLIYLDYLVFR